MSQKLLASYVNPAEPGSLGGVNAFAKAQNIHEEKHREYLKKT